MLLLDSRIDRLQIGHLIRQPAIDVGGVHPALHRVIGFFQQLANGRFVSDGKICRGRG